MKLYKLKDLVEVLSTPLSTLQNWARTGYIPAFKVAQSWCVRESDLDKWLEDLNSLFRRLRHLSKPSLRK